MKIKYVICDFSTIGYEEGDNSLEGQVVLNKDTFRYWDKRCYEDRYIDEGGKTFFIYTKFALGHLVSELYLGNLNLLVAPWEYVLGTVADVLSSIAN